MTKALAALLEPCSIYPYLNNGSTYLSGIADAIAELGYVFVPDFIDERTGLELLSEVRTLREGGVLQDAGVGFGEERKVRSEIRSDEVRWLDPANLTMVQSAYWDLMEALRLSLNEELFLGLFDLEAHLACYPPGAFYKAHLDCHRGTSTRTLSAIVYLNRDWEPEDGGTLRLYTDRIAGRDGPFLDIEPRFGRLVLFLSADFWHEVLPARRERFSLTGWFRKRTGDTSL